MKHIIFWIFFLLSKSCEATEGYTLTTSSDNATIGLDFTFTCVTTETLIAFTRGATTVCSITGGNTDGTCTFNGGYNTNYTYTCNSTTNTYTVNIPGSYLTESLHGTKWKYGNPFGGEGSNDKILYVNVPVSSTTLLSTPTDKNPVEVVSNRRQTFSCTTNAARPSSRIQWYLSTTNITTSASPQPDICNTDCRDDKVISSSVLTYTGSIDDDGKILYCTAVNIEGGSVVRSSSKTIDIWYGPNQVTIKPSIQSYTLNETDNLNQIQCTADCRPGCTMTWSGPNLLAGTTSLLNLQNINRNQTGNYQCTASNAVSSKTSVVVNVVIQYGPIQIEISPVDNTYTVNETGSVNEITCTADCNPSCITTWTGPNIPACSTSILNLTSIDRSQTGAYNCTAVNVISSLTLNKVKVIVNYGPRQVVIYPTASNYTRNETFDRVGPINCTANCKPACTSTWNGPNLPPDTTSVLSLANINRNQTGNYQCTASNYVSSVISATVFVVVNYKPTISAISNDKVVNETDTAIINCTVDSIPHSIIRWMFETKELQNKYDGSLTLNKIECLSMGRYTCKAVNMLGVDTRDVNVTVICSPRINMIEFDIPSMVAIKDEGILNITAHIIAFPQPYMYWQFANNVSYLNVSSGITNIVNINRQSSNLVKSNLTEEDFGNYSVYAYNGVGSTHNLLHSVVVVPARKPNQPINVTCEGRLNSVNVNWKSGFNGGKDQTFTVYYKRNDNDGNSKWTAFERTYSDAGQNMYTSAEIQPLEAGASFSFQVYASNEYSYTVSETSFCNTSEAGISKESKDQSVIIGAGAGVGSAIAILLVIGVIVFMIKRRRDGSPGQDKKLIKRRSSNKEDLPTYNEADDIDGLHANPMYVSAELHPNVNASKKMETEKTDTANEDDGHVYSQVKKKDKKGKKEKDFEMGSVYENAEDIANSRVDALRVSEKATMDSKQRHKYQPKRNKDGLVYADLELSRGPSGKRLVIRGLENRNNYAIIDLTKTAEPFPSDSESENEKEKTEANDKKGNNKQE